MERLAESISPLVISQATELLRVALTYARTYHVIGGILIGDNRGPLCFQLTDDSARRDEFNTLQTQARFILEKRRSADLKEEQPYAGVALSIAGSTGLDGFIVCSGFTSPSENQDLCVCAVNDVPFLRTAALRNYSLAPRVHSLSQGLRHT